MTLIDIFK